MARYQQKQPTNHNPRQSNGKRSHLSPRGRQEKRLRRLAGSRKYKDYSDDIMRSAVRAVRKGSSVRSFVQFVQFVHSF